MVRFNKKNIVVLLFFLAYNTLSMGYNAIFSNVTERFLVLCYKLEGLSQEYYQIIPPDQSISHYFPNLHCFGQSILWAELKEKDSLGKDIPFNGGLDLVDPESGTIAPDMQQLFKQYVANKYAFIPMQIKVVNNETFQFTIDAAEELMQGIDELACQTINTTVQFMNPLPSINPPSMQNVKAQQKEKSFDPLELLSSVTESTNNQPTKPSKTAMAQCRFGLGKLAKGGANLAGVSLCRDLHFAIVDTGEVGTPMQTKPGVIVSRLKKPILIAEINQGG